MIDRKTLLFALPGFGKGPTEKDPNHGHLAGGLRHSEGAERSNAPGLPDLSADTETAGNDNTTRPDHRA